MSLLTLTWREGRAWPLSQCHSGRMGLLWIFEGGEQWGMPLMPFHFTLQHLAPTLSKGPSVTLLVRENPF